MINLILDTCIYRHDPRREKPAFQVLEKLAKQGEIKLYIPYVVEREFQTQQRDACKGNLDKASKGLSKLLNTKLPFNVSKEVSAIESSLSSAYDKVLEGVETEFVEWANDIEAERVPLDIDQANKSLEAYFQGLAPLKEPKVRKDIPDSFVARAVENVALSCDELHFVVEDKALRENFSSLDNVSTYESLIELINSSVIQDLLIESSILEDYEALKSAVEAFEGESNLLNSCIWTGLGKELLDMEIEDTEIPDDNHTATINMHADPENIVMDFDHVVYFGDGEIGVPFTAEINVGAYFYIFKADYFALDGLRDDLPSVTDHNDHYYEAEDNFQVSVTAVVIAKIDEQKVIDTGNIDGAIDSPRIAEIIDVEVIGIG